MRHSHGSSGLVAPLHAAMLAQGYVESSVHQRLVGIVVVGEQTLLEFTLIMEDCLQGTKTHGRKTVRNMSGNKLHQS